MGTSYVFVHIPILIYSGQRQHQLDAEVSIVSGHDGEFNHVPHSQTAQSSPP
jgi:hypothetical protein